MREQARLELGLKSDKFVALFYGRIIPDKGVHVLVEAWKRSKRLQDAGTLLIVGTSPLTGVYEQELRSFAPPSCVFLPMRRDVITPLHAADVVVLPSLWNEPFGRVVIEAMATGCPVIATRVGGIPEILTERFTSLLVDRNDPDALAIKIESLMGWQKREPGLSEACRAHVCERFGLGGMVDALEDLFSRALQHRGFHL
jgi:glycosyltransferase involved in cell wall biosynthesis